jgi:hypothetical protein
MIGQIIDALQARIHPFNNKIYECLRLNRPSGDEFSIVLANFHGPLCDSPHCFFTLEYSNQWAVRYDPNYVRQEVMLQLPGRHEYWVEQFLHLWISYLSVLQDFTDKVHGLLPDLRYHLLPFNGDDYADHSVGSRYVQ